MNWTATVEISALGLMALCVLAFVGLGAISRMFMPKVRLWAVIEPSDGHIVATHRKKDYAQELIHGNRYLVEMTGTLKP